MRLVVLVVCLLFPAVASADQLRIVSRIGQDGVADAAAKRARRDQGVTLFAALERGGVVYSDAGRVRWGGKIVQARPFAGSGVSAIRWFKIEPEVENLSNTASGSFKYEAVPYVETAIAGGASLPADVRPTRTTDRGGGLGTMRYKLTVVAGGVTLSTPGLEARRGKGSGGLADSVHRVSLRKDDSYLGMLTEMYGQPYIWASAGASAATHQSERLEGSDCADFVVYGWRRLGHDVAYTWTGGLPKVTTRLAAGARDSRGVYVDGKGQPIAFPAPGDIVLYPRHVGVLVRDAGVIGVLDDEDILVHTLFESPHETRLAESGFADQPVEVRRWKK